MNKAATLLNETIQPITAVAPAVCTENPIRIDWGGNHLTSAYNDRTAMFCPDRLGLAIQVEEPV